MRWPGRVLVTALAVLLLPFAAPAGAAPSSATTTAAAPTTVASAALRPPSIDVRVDGSVTDTVVDPETGRLFASAGGEVIVFAPDGAVLRRLAGIPGARGMSVEGPSLYVVSTTLDSIVQIDLTTFLPIRLHPIPGYELLGSIAVVDGSIWVLAGRGETYHYLVGLDPDGGMRVSEGFIYGAHRLEEIPGSTDRLLAYDMGLSPYSIYVYDLSGEVPKVVDDVPHGIGSNLRDVVATDDGRIFAASGAPYSFTEIDLETMEPTGFKGDGKHYPSGIAYTPARGGVFVGVIDGYYSEDVFVWRGHDGTSTHRWAFSGSIGGSGNTVQVSPAGDRAYVFDLTYADGVTTAHLYVLDLAPRIDEVAPSTVVRRVPTTVRLTGDGLTAATRITVDGVDVGFARDYPHSVLIDIPAADTDGARVVRIETPWGATSRAIDVTPWQPAALEGTVREGHTVWEGATVTLHSTGVVPAPETTSDIAGRFSFEGLVHDPEVRVEVELADGRHWWSELAALVPGERTEAAVDLAGPSGGNDLRTTPVAAGVASDLAIDPATGRVFVATGNEVVALEADGARVGRVIDATAVRTLVPYRGMIYAVRPQAAAVSEIDPVTLTVRRTFSTDFLVEDGVAPAHGRLWFTPVTEPGIGLAAIDLASGAFETYEPDLVDPWGRTIPIDLVPIEGDETHFAGAMPSGAFVLWDASSLPPVAGEPVTPGSPYLRPGSGALQRIWTANGTEHRLPDFAPTGVKYGSPEISASVDGGPDAPVLQFGAHPFERHLYRYGEPRPTHSIWDEPYVVSDAPERGYGRGETGAVTVEDLTPLVRLLRLPDPSSPSRWEVYGEGLGAVRRVTVDDVPAAVSDERSPTELEITLPTTAPGAHVLRVTTAGGSSAPFTFVVEPPDRPNLVALRRSDRPQLRLEEEVSSERTTEVILAGEALTRVDGVTMGTEPVPFEVLSDTRIRVQVPPRPHGTTARLAVQSPIGNTDPAWGPLLTWRSDPPPDPPDPDPDPDPPDADPGVVRLAGTDRIGTGIATAQAMWQTHGAGAVVLARSDHFADALAGGPLAASLNAPILLNPTAVLDPRVLAEIHRVLPAGGDVHLLGGTTSLTPSVASALTQAGYDVHRHGGADRYATAVAIAQAIGSPERLLLVSGRDFPDGLSAGAAAARLDGAVLLTDGGRLPAATSAYLDDHLGTPVTAIGGPAAAAQPTAPSIVGSDRYETARLVADQLFPEEVAWAGLASGERFPDALVAGAHLGRVGGPLLLARAASIPTTVEAWLRQHVTTGVVVYGGSSAVSWSGWTS